MVTVICPAGAYLGRCARGMLSIFIRALHVHAAVLATDVSALWVGVYAVRVC